MSGKGRTKGAVEESIHLDAKRLKVRKKRNPTGAAYFSGSDKSYRGPDGTAPQGVVGHPLAPKDGPGTDVRLSPERLSMNGRDVIPRGIRTIPSHLKTEGPREEGLLSIISGVSPAGLSGFDENGHCIYVDERWLRIHDCSAEEAYGDGWTSVLYPEDRARVIEAWKNAVREERPLQSEYRLQRKDKTIRWIMGKGSPVVARGLPHDLRYLGSITDITHYETRYPSAGEDLSEGRISDAELKARVTHLYELNAHLIRRIEQRTVVETQLKDSTDRLHMLTAHLQKLREQEKASFARELHSEVGQTLTAVKMGLSWLQRQLPVHEGPAVRKAQSLLADIDRTIFAIQRISTALRPAAFDDFGLAEALRLGVRDFQRKACISCMIHIMPENMKLDKELSVEIFRIFHEGLTNIAKHSQAQQVSVVLKKRKGELVMELRDDGRGITKREIADRNSFGLSGMRERAYVIGGEFSITGKKGKGTTIVLRVPVNTS